MAKPRSAEATIRGFNFQFAATILLILQSDHDAEIVVEGIEDVDLNSGEGVQAIQCKYYEGTKLTNSILRDIVKPMLGDDKNRKTKIKYHVYGYFNDKVELPLSDTNDFRSKVLCYTKGKGKKKQTFNVADDLGLSDAELDSFRKRLNFTYTKKYDAHREEVVKAIRTQMNCGLDEARSVFYPNAFTLISELGTKSTQAARTISRANFLSQINSKQVIFHQWLLQAEDEAKYCRTMRRNFFTQSNISPFARFFVVECDGSEPIHAVKSVVSNIRHKWSSHRRRRLTPKDRYSPYILLNNMPSDVLVRLKSQLYNEGVRFVDGFPFKGADFSAPEINQQQTFENQISVRFLRDHGDLTVAIEAMPSSTCEVYEFYRNSRLPKSGKTLHVQIPVSNISLVEQII